MKTQKSRFNYSNLLLGLAFLFLVIGIIDRSSEKQGLRQLPMFLFTVCGGIYWLLDILKKDEKAEEKPTQQPERSPKSGISAIEARAFAIGFYEGITGDTVSNAANILAGELVQAANKRFQYIQENIRPPGQMQFKHSDPIDLGTAYEDNLMASFLFFAITPADIRSTFPAGVIIVPKSSDVSSFLGRKWGPNAVSTQAVFKSADLTIADLTELIQRYTTANALTKGSKESAIGNALSESSKVLVVDEVSLITGLFLFSLKDKVSFWIPRWVVAMSSRKCVAFGAMNDAMNTVQLQKTIF